MPASGFNSLSAQYAIREVHVHRGGFPPLITLKKHENCYENNRGVAGDVDDRNGHANDEMEEKLQRNGEKRSGGWLAVCGANLNEKP